MAKTVRSATEEQQHLQDLVNRCLIFTDRNGKVLNKVSTPVTSWLGMKYEGKDLYIQFSVAASAMGNGGSRVIVKHKGKLVLQATGSFTVAAFNLTAKVYIPGAWEKKIPTEFAK